MMESGGSFLIQRIICPVPANQGTDYVDEIRSRQQTVIAMLLAPGAIVNIHNTHLQYPTTVYSVEDYLNDVFDMVWKPLDDPEEQQNSFRRQQQRAYIDFLGLDLNPTFEKDANLNTIVLRSDAILFLEQHLDKVENYLKTQHQTDGLNAAHYQNLLLRVKRIREKYESGK